VFTIVVNRARTRGAHEARTVASSQIGVEQDAGPTVDPARFQGPDGEYPGHWTSAGAPQPWVTSPEHRALSAEAMTVIERAVDRLPPRQRLVVTLRDVQGMSCEEACAVLEITAQNQRVLLHRARAALRGSLEEYYRC
jgi:RNA polymerase sigma-70 factor (ECF subfamily)